MALKWHKIHTPSGNVFEAVLSNGNPIYIQRGEVFWKAILITDDSVLNLCVATTPYRCQIVLDAAKFQ